VTYEAFIDVPTTTLADLLTREQVMDTGIRPLWDAPRIAGPAYTVTCTPGDNLMLHAAIHRAEPGSVIVVQSGDMDYALAGGNVCDVAQRRGIAGFVLDGVIRDLAEIREAAFPVFARGIIPIPGTKKKLGTLGEPARVGGVLIHPGDIVVADEDGVVVTPSAKAADTLSGAQSKLAKEATETLDTWEQNHRARIDKALAEQGFTS
jgi:regulator of RNase E activity RraA